MVGEIIAFSGVLYSASEAVRAPTVKLTSFSTPLPRLQPLTYYGLLLMSPSVRDSSLCTFHPLTKLSSVRNYGKESILLSFQERSLTFLVRPEFTDTLAIKSGRHPVLETVQSTGTLVSNDIYCSDAARFHIVQGPK